MTQARTLAHGVGSPSPLDLWIDAMLRVFAELVRHVAGCVVFRQPDRTADNRPLHKLEADAVASKHQETSLAEPDSDLTKALILRTRSTDVERVDSKDEDWASSSLNASFSGSSRESRFERHWNSQESHGPPNRDSRDALRLPENDPSLALWPNPAQQQQQQQQKLQLSAIRPGKNQPTRVPT